MKISNAILCGTVVCFFMITPTVSLSMLEKLPAWLSAEKFAKQETKLQNLQEKDERTVRRKTQKIFSNRHKDYNGNTTFLIEKIVTHHRNTTPIGLALENIANDLRNLIGKKFSNLPNDPYSSIGILLWLEEKQRNHILKRFLKTYLSNPPVFTETVSTSFYRKADEEVFV